MYMMELLEDIIVKILCKLPLKSLIRFSCVSKRWFWLIITDQHVAKSHYRLATEQKSLTKRFLVIKVNDSLNSLHSDTPGLVDYSTRNLTPPLSTIRRILGSCNGLICLSSEQMSDFYIWNPSTRFLHKLPDPPFFSKIIRPRVYFFGFGYTSATDDYKVVVSGSSFGHSRVFLFSWRAGCWKRIESPYKCILKAGYPPVLLRERLHWFMTNIFKIINFNLADEKFSRIRLPPANSFHWVCSSYGRSLYLTGFREGFDIQLWVMRKYDVQRSWTKLFHYKTPIYYPNHHIFVTAKARLVLAGRDSNGFDSTKMICIECKEDGQLVVDEIETSYCAEMIIYGETLLSLPDIQKMPENFLAGEED